MFIRPKVIQINARTLIESVELINEFREVLATLDHCFA